MDSDQFFAAPTTSATLKAYYLKHGQHTASNDIRLIHFRDEDHLRQWTLDHQEALLTDIRTSQSHGQQPIIGFSFYTWNAAEFLALVASLKKQAPGVLSIAGGPHVQQAEDYLGYDPIDLIVLGEGEQTFTQILDCQDNDFSHVNGLAFLDADNKIVETPSRERIKNLSDIPSPLDVLPLTDDNGNALYESIAYETSRGCPYKCAFCEWGTGAIGSKMNQFPMAQIHKDWRTIVDAGIKNIWLADSNFGALREDLEKTELICELKKESGLPITFATSWSKKHNQRTQEMVLLLNKNGLLPHYQLALQTLTPLALTLSNRKNMDSNKYERIAKDMANCDVPIAAELIWGLPGDNLNDYETNLDILLGIFPNINIFGYTLLPGTEFYKKRHTYEIQTLPVAGYGKAKGEYVIGCHTFDTNEGIEGYFLITAHIILNHGYLLPLTIRLMALQGSVPVSTLLRKVLHTLLETHQSHFDGLDLSDKMHIYENRARIYLALFEDADFTYKVIENTITDWLDQHAATDIFKHQVSCTIALDKVLKPMSADRQQNTYDFPFDARELLDTLSKMELPSDAIFTGTSNVTIESPGGVGSLLHDPDGGSWMKGHIVEQESPAALNASEPVVFVAGGDGRPLTTL
ncbi:Anaerobic magnesium-protoporphyrin IX monomethyl ester cyclase [BD1-7 clade bacterium]|uniref:Anaerobic magnesium-protoporphyrin IX monomethyl ester cyclase n=1 Tax=BD1-7 clade bacterium TaxID=2029982 RepID=A0A5S9QZD8_9GAMM|nr:Anaerobic magnesium-protoporphyrin IX monomethyl ester cyclase [BD1-7 clade bacterium]